MKTRNISLVSMAALESEEMRYLERRTEQNIYRKAVEKAERKAWELEREVARQKKAHEKERNELIAFVGTISGAITAIACFLSAPWWTGIAPVLLVVLLMRKVGWL